MRCPLCDSLETQRERTSAVTQVYEGRIIAYCRKCRHCETCGAEWAGASELDFNAEQSRAAMAGVGLDPNVEIIRQEFEAFQARQGNALKLAKNEDMSYQSAYIRRDWQVWCAASGVVNKE